MLITALAGSVRAAGELSNRRAPGFSLPDSDLKQHDLQDYRGKVVVLNVMRTACTHCGEFSQALAEAQKRFGDKIQVISIVNPPDNQKTVAQYKAKNQVTAPILFDCGQVTASYLKITPQNPSIQVPHFFVIDGEGMIREDYGYSETDNEAFEGPGLIKILEKYVPRPTLARAR
jgi:peroxiredoxin